MARNTSGFICDGNDIIVCRYLLFTHTQTLVGMPRRSIKAQLMRFSVEEVFTSHRITWLEIDNFGLVHVHVEISSIQLDSPDSSRRLFVSCIYEWWEWEEGEGGQAEAGEIVSLWEMKFYFRWHNFTTEAFSIHFSSHTAVSIWCPLIIVFHPRAVEHAKLCLPLSALWHFPTEIWWVCVAGNEMNSMDSWNVITLDGGSTANVCWTVIDEWKHWRSENDR
jgi:hypothetical protein